MRALSALAAIGLALAACQTAQPTPPAAPPPSDYSYPGVTPSTFRMPGGTGCSGEVERFQAVIDNDLASGQLVPLQGLDIPFKPAILGGYHFMAREDRWHNRTVAQFRNWLLRMTESQGQ